MKPFSQSREARKEMVGWHALGDQGRPYEVFARSRVGVGLPTEAYPCAEKGLFLRGLRGLCGGTEADSRRLYTDRL